MRFNLGSGHWLASTGGFSGEQKPVFYLEKPEKTLKNLRKKKLGFCLQLVGGFSPPLWKIWLKVSWDDYSIPNWMGKQKHVPNHQPALSFFLQVVDLQFIHSWSISEWWTKSTPGFDLEMLRTWPIYVHKSGWWCNVPILKNDGLRQWEGWHPFFFGKIMFETPPTSIFPCFPMIFLWFSHDLKTTNQKLIHET